MIKDFKSELEQLTKKIDYLEKGESVLQTDQDKVLDTIEEIEPESETHGAIRRVRGKNAIDHNCVFKRVHVFLCPRVSMCVAEGTYLVPKFMCRPRMAS